MHGVRRELLARQAEALGPPARRGRDPAELRQRVYEQRMAEALRRARRCPASRRSPSATCSSRMSAPTAKSGSPRPAARPLPALGRATRPSSRASSSTPASRRRSSASTRARSTPSFAGRRYDEALLADLPDGVDPCGENGEFHTFVHAGPDLRRADRLRAERSSSATDSSSAT